MRECRCTPQQIAQYVGRLSGPLRDRFDLTVDVPRVPADALGSTAEGESSADIRARVVLARTRQLARLGHTATPMTNGRLSGASMRSYCGLDAVGIRLLRTAVDRLGMSARGFERVRRVARTIADLSGEDAISSTHVAEALQFRVG